MAEKVAGLLGTRVAETILASVHARAHSKVGHMDASDLIKTGCMILRGGRRPHMVSGSGPGAFQPGIFRGPVNPAPICQPSPPAVDQAAFSLPRLYSPHQRDVYGCNALRSARVSAKYGLNFAFCPLPRWRRFDTRGVGVAVNVD